MPAAGYLGRAPARLFEVTGAAASDDYARCGARVIGNNLRLELTRRVETDFRRIF